MQRFFYLFFLLFTFSLAVFGQNVTITPNGITPALSGTYPRLSYEAILALPSPQKGDIAYDVTFECLRVFAAGKWVCTHQDPENYVPNVRPIITAGGNDYDEVKDMAVSANGDVYLVGLYAGTASFDTISVSTAKSQDSYIARYNKNGQVYWVRRISSPNNLVVITSVATDALGNVYVAGTYTDTATFGTTTISAVDRSKDIFVAKYTKEGVLSWVRSAGDIGYGEEPTKITVDASGNVYVAGYYFNSVTFGTTTINSLGSSDIFIAKYNTTGTLQWVLSAGGTGTDFIYGLAADNNGNVYVTGEFLGATKFGTYTRTSQGSTDIFLARFNSVGLSWDLFTTWGGTGSDLGRALALSNDGYVYVTGYFMGTALFGTTSKTSRGSYDYFLAKYSTTGGGLAWVKTFGGPDTDLVSDIVLDANGGIYLTGSFTDVIDVVAESKASKGITDVLVTKFTKEGSFEWVKTFGGTSTDNGVRLGFDGSGNLHAAGNFLNTVKFGNITKTSAGGTDIFVTRFDK